MPRIIQTFCEVMPEESTIVRSGYLRNNIRSNALLKEARRRAREITEQATFDAADALRQASAQGYADGLLQSAEMLVSYLGKHAQLAAQWQASLGEQVRTLLRESVSQPEVLMAAAEQFLQTGELSGELRVELLLPQSLRSYAGVLVERLKRSIPKEVAVDFWGRDAVLIRAGEHVAELDADQFVNIAQMRAMSALPPAYGACREIVEEYQKDIETVFRRAIEVLARERGEEVPE